MTSVFIFSLIFENLLIIYTRKKPWWIIAWAYCRKSWSLLKFALLGAAKHHSPINNQLPVQALAYLLNKRKWNEISLTHDECYRMLIPFDETLWVDPWSPNHFLERVYFWFFLRWTWWEYFQGKNICKKSRSIILKMSNNIGSLRHRSVEIHIESEYYAICRNKYGE